MRLNPSWPPFIKGGKSLFEKEGFREII